MNREESTYLCTAESITQSGGRQALLVEQSMATFTRDGDTVPGGPIPVTPIMVMLTVPPGHPLVGYWEVGQRYMAEVRLIEPDGDDRGVAVRQ